MTDRDIIDRVAAMTGRKVQVCRVRSGWKTTYRVTVCGDQAAKLMREILPWMGERRSRRIQEILDDHLAYKLNKSRSVWMQAA